MMRLTHPASLPLEVYWQSAYSKLATCLARVVISTKNESRLNPIPNFPRIHSLSLTREHPRQRNNLEHTSACQSRNYLEAISLENSLTTLPAPLTFFVLAAIFTHLKTFEHNKFDLIDTVGIVSAGGPHFDMKMLAMESENARFDKGIGRSSFGI